MRMRSRVVLLTGVAVLAITAFYGMFSSGGDEINDRIENSPQFSDGKFRNPGRNYDFSLGKTISAAWEFTFGKDKDTKPGKSLPRQPVDLSAFSSRDDNQLVATWLGHSSLMINIDGSRILADPVFEESVSFFGPTRYNGEVPMDVEGLPEIDVVVISHDHYDHLNEHSIKSIHHKTALFVAPLGVGNILLSWGVPQDKIVELDWWEECKVGEDLSIVSTPAQHFSGRGLTDRNKSLWTSYVIKSRNHKVFFGGDSGYFDGFKKIGDKYGPFEMTFLECGAYDEKWIEIHMLPEETVQAHLDLHGDILHPIHWGTFDLALHAWYEPMTRLVIAAQSSGVKLATPIVGGTTVFGKVIPNEFWWESAIE